MSYLVLARKYRPRQFSELIGQQHVATTLLNAFKQNKLGQAYLLTGTRGVGKTSVARIFAKALRCENPDSQPGGKNPGVSCEKCQSCVDINNGTSIDVLEIDGASNNGVDNVRELREQVKFLPSRGRLRVYIIDEVHMLTNAAFNALLKTLEEPPAHVTFILATTESQKIPATILSRCQRFDFRRVPLPLISEHLARIASLEGIKSDLGAIKLIAKKADGSMRDGLSALDQCLALGGKELSVQGVTESLGIVSSEFLIKILRHSLNRDLVPAAELIQSAFLGGVEMKLIALGLAETLRNALFVKLRADSNISEVSPEELPVYEDLVTPLSPEGIQAAYRSITNSLDEILRSPLPRASLEMALARLAGIGHLKSLQALLTQLETPNANPKSLPKDENQSAASKRTLPVYQIPNSDPVIQPEKKSPESPLPPASTLNDGLSSFVKYVLQQKASLGAILEHAIPVSNAAQWKTDAEIRIGFRKSHAFYQLQAQHKANFDQLERYLQSMVGRKARLVIESVSGSASPQSSSVSIVEKEKIETAKSMADTKKKFLEHEVVRNTKEIFGAELSSFDIDKSLK